MSAGRPARACAASALVALAFGVAAPAAPLAAAAADGDSARLALVAPRWALEGRAVELAVEPRGALEGRNLTLTVAVDGRAVDRVACAGVRTTFRLAAAHLPAGTHEIAVKSGSERSSARIRVVSRRVLWIPAALAAALAVTVFLVARRRRRRAT